MFSFFRKKELPQYLTFRYIGPDGEREDVKKVGGPDLTEDYARNIIGFAFDGVLYLKYFYVNGEARSEFISILEYRRLKARYQSMSEEAGSMIDDMNREIREIMGKK